MIDFLSNPWTITVVGGLVVVLIGYYLFGVGKNKETNKVNGNVNTQVKGDNNIVGSDITVTNVYEQEFSKQELSSTEPKESVLSPLVIKNKIKDSPLLQQHVVADAYIGRRVTWKIKIDSLREYDEIYSVSASPFGDSSYPTIDFDVKVEDYPILKSIRADETAFIKGVIANVETYRIHLNDAKLIFIDDEI